MGKKSKKLKKQNDKLNYQLGTYVGELIVALHLPTLSTDMLQTNKVIQVSEEKAKAWKEMDDKHHDLWLSKGAPNSDEETTKLFYENRKWYMKNIEDVYLPNELKIQIPKVNPTNLEKFKKGLDNALWDCDLSHYDLDPEFFVQTDRIAWCSIINLRKTVKTIPEKFA